MTHESRSFEFQADNRSTRQSRLMTFYIALRHVARVPFILLKFFFRAYRLHWFATPAGAIAAVVSTMGAATLMLAISPVVHRSLAFATAIAANAVIAPLLAYALYLSVYYFGMYIKERNSLIDDKGQISPERRKDWLRVVKYDYLAHLPSDVYLVTLAGIMQAALEAKGAPIFWAVFTSQFVDDLLTFLKEPAFWNGAKEVVAWEKSKDTTVWRHFVGGFRNNTEIFRKPPRDNPPSDNLPIS